jgi:hypothetical protein
VGDEQVNVSPLNCCPSANTLEDGRDVSINDLFKNLRRCDAALDCDWRWLGARRSLDDDGMEAVFGTRCRGWLAHTSSTHGRTVFLWERIARCTVACANGSSSITLDD